MKLLLLATSCDVSPVYFRHKIKKLLTGESLNSARRHLLRARHKPAFPLEKEAVIRTIDNDDFEQIRRQYALDDPGEDWPKYLDLDRWIDINIRRIRRLDLDLPPSRRILDLGAGAGYFAHIARLFRHDVLALDVDAVPMFRKITKLLEVPRVIHEIRSFTPLPDLGERFDLVTAFQVCFNQHKQTDLWGVPEWNFFLDDLRERLKPGGHVWLELNRESSGECYSPELKQLFEQRGAKIDEHRVGFTSILPAPSSISPAAR